jgi:aspartyl-tRNA(Asn)/glutamyl-tRNA(Gln) amidotransferase subunit C
MIDVNHVTKLARLGLTEKEKKKLSKELPAILEFVNKLEQVKTDKVEPTAQVTGLENVTREDKGRAKTRQETDKLLELAPEVENRYVKVKAIL